MTVRLHIGSAQRDALSQRQGFLLWCDEKPWCDFTPEDRAIMRVLLLAGHIEFEEADAVILARAIIEEANRLDDFAQYTEVEAKDRAVCRQWRDALSRLAGRVGLVVEVP